MELHLPSIFFLAILLTTTVSCEKAVFGNITVDEANITSGITLYIHPDYLNEISTSGGNLSNVNWINADRVNGTIVFDQLISFPTDATGNNVVVGATASSWQVKDLFSSGGLGAINAVTAGTGLSGGGNEGSVTLNYDYPLLTIGNLSNLGSYSHSGHLSGTLASSTVVNTLGLSTTNITSGEFPDARISNDITVNGVVNSTDNTTFTGNNHFILAGSSDHDFTLQDGSIDYLKVDTLNGFLQLGVTSTGQHQYNFTATMLDVEDNNIVGTQNITMGGVICDSIGCIEVDTNETARVSILENLQANDLNTTSCSATEVYVWGYGCISNESVGVDTQLSEAQVEGYIFDVDNTGSLYTSGGLEAGLLNSTGDLAFYGEIQPDGATGIIGDILVKYGSDDWGFSSETGGRVNITGNLHVDGNITTGGATQNLFIDGVNTEIISLDGTDIDMQADGLTVNSSFTFPGSDGSNGQVLKTDGAGTLTWQADSTGGGGASPEWESDGTTITSNSSAGSTVKVDGYLNVSQDLRIADGNLTLGSVISPEGYPSFQAVGDIFEFYTSTGGADQVARFVGDGSNVKWNLYPTGGVGTGTFGYYDTDTSFRFYNSQNGGNISFYPGGDINDMLHISRYSDGKPSLVSSGGNLTIDDNLYVTGNNHFDGTLRVTGDSTFNNQVAISDGTDTLTIKSDGDDPVIERDASRSPIFFMRVGQDGMGRLKIEDETSTFDFYSGDGGAISLYKANATYSSNSWGGKGIIVTSNELVFSQDGDSDDYIEFSTESHNNYIYKGNNVGGTANTLYFRAGAAGTWQTLEAGTVNQNDLGFKLNNQVIWTMFEGENKELIWANESGHAQMVLTQDGNLSLAGTLKENQDLSNWDYSEMGG